MPRFLLLLCVLALHPRAEAQTDPAATVDALLTAYDSDETPGAVVAVVRDGETVFAEAYGSADLEHRVPITPETVFYIGSVGKQFTAFAVAVLADRGLVSLDEDIRMYLPELAYSGPPIRVRHLIHHTSGLRDSFALLALAGVGPGDLITQDRALGLILRQASLNFEPGTDYSYSNANYILLAEIAERVTGQSFREWMDENVFAPLGMEHSQIGDDHREVIANRAASYARSADGGYETEVFPFSAYGAGGVYTTAGDLAAWLRNARTAEVGGREVAAQMLERGVLANGDTLAYAFGLILGEHRGRRRIFHDGGLAGYRSSLAYYPEIDAGVMVLANGAPIDASGLNRSIAEAFFAADLEPLAAPASAAEPETPAVASVTVTGVLLDAYVGRFQISGGPVFEVQRSGDGLSAQIVGQPAFSVTALADTLFRVEVPGEDIQLGFQKDADGSVSGGVLYDGGAPIPFERASWAPDPAAMRAYAGRYASTELETTYEVRLVGDRLVLAHPRHGEIDLTPNQEDSFIGAEWFTRSVVFERDTSGSVARMLVSEGRAQNVAFDKVSRE